MSDAIAQDVALEEVEITSEAPAKKPELTEREKALNEIARRRYEEEGIDYGSESDDGEPLAAEQGESEDPVDPVAPDEKLAEEKANSDPLAELGYYRNSNGDLVTKMKINGVEREVRADQVKAHLQKDLAGDWKLQQAADKERQLNELARSLQDQRGQQIKQSLSQPRPPLGAEEAKQQARAVLEKIWDGDSDAAAEALAAIIQRDTTATVDSEKILEEARKAALSSVEQREAERRQQEWEGSVEKGNAVLREQHPEIYADQYLFDMVNGETARMVQAQQAGVPEFANLTPQQMIENAANTVQSWLDERNPTKAQGTRSERKAGLKPMPRGMGTARQAPAKQEIDMSPAAVIKRMQDARRVG